MPRSSNLSGSRGRLGSGRSSSSSRRLTPSQKLKRYYASRKSDKDDKSSGDRFGSKSGFVIVQTPGGYKRVPVSQVDEQGIYRGPGSASKSTSETVKTKTPFSSTPLRSTVATKTPVGKKQTQSSSFIQAATDPFQQRQQSIDPFIAEQNTRAMIQRAISSAPRLQKEQEEIEKKQKALEQRRGSISTEAEAEKFNRQVEAINQQSALLESGVRRYKFYSKLRDKDLAKLRKTETEFDKIYSKEVKTFDSKIPNTSQQPKYIKVDRFGALTELVQTFSGHRAQLEKAQDEFYGKWYPIDKVSANLPKSPKADISVDFSRASKLDKVTFSNIDEARSIVGKAEAQRAISQGTVDPIRFSTDREIIEKLKGKVTRFDDIETGKLVGQFGLTAASVFGVGVGVQALSKLPKAAKITKVLSSKPVAGAAWSIYAGGEGFNVKSAFKEISRGNESLGVYRLGGVASRLSGAAFGAQLLSARPDIKVTGIKSKTDTLVQPGKSISITETSGKIRVQQPLQYRLIGRKDQVFDIKGVSTTRAKPFRGKSNIFSTKTDSRYLVGKDIKIKETSRGLFENIKPGKKIDFSKFEIIKGGKTTVKNIVSVGKQKGIGTGRTLSVDELIGEGIYTTTSKNILTAKTPRGKLIRSKSVSLGTKGKQYKELRDLFKLTKAGTNQNIFTTRKGTGRTTQDINLGKTSAKTIRKPFSFTSTSGAKAISLSKNILGSQRNYLGSVKLFPPVTAYKNLFRLGQTTKQRTRYDFSFKRTPFFKLSNLNKVSLEPITGVRFTPITDVGIDTSTAIIPKSININRYDYRDFRFGDPIIPPVTPSPKIPFVPIVPGFLGGIGGGIIRRRGKKQKRFTKYTRSVYAELEGLSGKRKKFLTGLEVRL